MGHAAPSLSEEELAGAVYSALAELVALPVKDPYHILRSVLLIIELLSRKLRKNGLV